MRHSSIGHGDIANSRERPLAVVATGLDENGTPSVALWWADSAGRPQAGWVFPLALALADPKVARRLLRVTDGRAVVGRTGVADGTLRALARCAGDAPASAVATVDLTGVSPGPGKARSGARGPWHGCPVIREVMAICHVVAGSVQHAAV